MGRSFLASARLRWLLATAGALAVLVVIGLAVASRLVNAPGFQSYVAQTASRALGRSVSFARLSIAVFPRPAVRLSRLQVAEDPAFGPGPFLAVGEGRMQLRLWPLLIGRVELVDLSLEAPTIELIEDGHGRWNWGSLGIAAPGASSAPRSGGRTGSPAMASVALSRITVVDGSMRYRSLGQAKDAGVRAEKINLALTQAPGGTAVRAQGDALVQPGGVKLTLVDASLSRVGGQALAEMPLKATVLLDARDVGALAAVITSEPSMTGPMKGRIEISGTAARPVVSGAMALERVVVSEDVATCEPRRRQLVMSDVRVPVAYAGTRLDSAPAESRVAGGTASAALAIDLGADRVTTLKDISVKGVEVGPLLADFLCHPFAVTGPLELTGEAGLRAGDPLWALNGSGRFRVGPGTVVGSEVAKLLEQALQVSGVIPTVVGVGPRVGVPLAFDSITGTYTISNGVLRTRDLFYQSAEVKVTGAGTYALRDGRVDMQVVLTQGPNEIHGVVSGTAGALHVAPTGAKIPDVRGIRRFVQTLLR
jgi:AsmA protein